MHQDKVEDYCLPDTGFVRLSTILRHIPVGRSTWWARVKSGEYPQPVRLGPQTTAWRAEDIRALIAKIGGSGVGAGDHE